MPGEVYDYTVFVKTRSQDNDVVRHWPLFILSLVQLFLLCHPFSFVPVQVSDTILFYSGLFVQIILD